MSASMMESHLVLTRLTPIKKALGSREWNLRKEKILATAHRVIGETLNNDDAYTIHGEETCMIAFAHTTVAQAEATATEMSDKIVRGLFGEIGVSTFPLEPRVLAIRDLLQNVTSEDAEGILSGILNDHEGDEPTNTSPGSEDDARKQAEKTSRRRKLFNLFEPEQPATVTHEYRAVWRVDDQKVERFRYVPCLQKVATERLVGYDVLGSNVTESDIVDLDIQSAENAIIDLKQAVDAGNDVKLSLPIDFETIGGNHGRSELLKIMPVLPESFRRRVSFTIDGIPEGIPEARLLEVVSFLRPFAESQSLMLNAIPANAVILKSILSKARSADMDTICLRLPREVSYDDLNAACSLVPQITTVGIRTAVFGLTSDDEVIRLVSAGASILGGPVFGGPFDAFPEPYSKPIGCFEGPQNKTTLPRSLHG